MSVIGKNYGKPTLDLNFAGNKSLIDTTTGTNYVTFTRAQSGNEATYVGSDGLIKYASADEPRFDHDPVTGESLGLLVEESRTNYLTNSSALHTWQTTFGPIVTANATTAPDGTITATSLVPASGQPNQIFLPNFDNKRNLSVFAKADGYDHIILVAQTAPLTSAGVLFSLSGSGNVVATNYGATGSIQQLANGWYRCTMTRSSTDTATMNTFIIRAADSSTPSGSYWAQSFVGDGTSGVYIWGAQHEEGSFPTSYIPTSGSTVTRAADLASIEGTNFSSWFNQSAGTFVGTVGSRGRLLLSSVSTGPNVYQDSTYSFSSNSEDYGGGFNLRYEDGSEVLLYYSIDGWTSSIPMQNYAGAYSAEGVAGAWEGNLGTPQTPLSKPLQDDLSHMWIGRTHSVSDSRVQHISRLSYYPKRLPDIELQQLTK